MKLSKEQQTILDERDALLDKRRRTDDEEARLREIELLIEELPVHHTEEENQASRFVLEAARLLRLHGENQLGLNVRDSGEQVEIIFNPQEVKVVTFDNGVRFIKK